MNSDLIELTGIRAFGYHGVLESEKRDGQEFIIDVSARVDIRPAARADDLSVTVDYGTLAQDIVTAVAEVRFDLIETLTEYLAQRILSDPAISAVTVTVHKPSAPIPVPFGDVAITITRNRDAPRVPLPTGNDAAIAVTPNSGTETATDLVGTDLVGATSSTELPPVPPPPAVTVPVLVPDPVAPNDPLDAPPGVPVHVVLALGANMGDAAGTLRQAIRELSTVDEFAVAGVGPLARTVPVGGPEGQPDYYNTVITAATTLSPRELLRVTQGVEDLFGRTREVHWGPRTLDIDIIAYGELVALSDELELPHPRAHERAFVLLPWAHLDRAAVLPGLGGGPVEMLAKTAPDSAGIKSVALDWFATETLPTPEIDAGFVPQVPHSPQVPQSPQASPSTQLPHSPQASQSPQVPQ